MHSSSAESLAFARHAWWRAYRDDPALLGYYLGDEPPVAEFPRLGELFARAACARSRRTRRGTTCSAAPPFRRVAAYRDYVERYVAATHPAVLSVDHYEFLQSGDRGQMAENIGTLAAVARENGLPFWGIIAAHAVTATTAT